MDKLNIFGLTFCITFYISFVSIVYIKDSEWQSKLCHQGYAEYYLDQDNKKQWRLIPLEDLMIVTLKDD